MIHTPSLHTKIHKDTHRLKYKNTKHQISINTYTCSNTNIGISTNSNTLFFSSYRYELIPFNYLIRNLCK